MLVFRCKKVTRRKLDFFCSYTERKLQNLSMQQAQPDRQYPWIFTKKTVFMQRVADKVRGGYNLYVQGSCTLEKAPHLFRKFSERYPLVVSKSTQDRRKTSNLNRYHWMAYFESDTQLVHWLLLLSPGAAPDTTETWRCPSAQRIKLTGYELVRLTRIGSAKPAWSWRYTRERHDDLRNALVSAIRTRRDPELQKLMHSIWRSPGFSGIREQVKKMKLLIQNEWKRSRSSAELPPEIPKLIGYVRRLPDVGEPWSDLMKKVKNETTEAPFRACSYELLLSRRVGRKAEIHRRKSQGIDS